MTDRRVEASRLALARKATREQMARRPTGLTREQELRICDDWASGAEIEALAVRHRVDAETIEGVIERLAGRDRGFGPPSVRMEATR